MAGKRKRKKRITKVFAFFILGLLGLGILNGFQYLRQVYGSDKEYTDLQEPTGSAFSETDDVNTSLKDLANQDKRIEKILQDQEQYPDDLLEMLSRNIEMLDFVLGYPTKKGKVYANKLDAFKEGEIPLLLQWDPRWGYAQYGDSSFASGGCAPTALAMVVAGLTGNRAVTPYVVAQYALENGYYVSGTGTSWSLMTEGSSHFHVQGAVLSLSKTAVYSALRAGYPIICSVRAGDFTTKGHFIVLVGIEDGLIQVHDPNSRERSNKLWDYDRIAPQIKNLWTFQKTS